MVVLKRTVFFFFKLRCSNELSAFATNATGQLDVFRHDRHSLGVNGAQVSVLEKTHQVSFASFLQSHDGRALETQVGFKVLRDLTYETLEGQLANEQLRALLITTYLPESDGARPVTMRLLHAAGRWRAFASCLGGELLARSLASRRFASGLLGTCHCGRLMTGRYNFGFI